MLDVRKGVVGFRKENKKAKGLNARLPIGSIGQNELVMCSK